MCKMKKLTYIIIFIIFLIACSKKSIIEKNELCGEWSDNGLIYRFGLDGTHERIRDGKIFYSGSYEIKGDELFFVSTDGKKTVAKLEIISSNRIEILVSTGFGVNIATPLEHSKICG